MIDKELTKELENLIDSAKTVSLSADEKSTIRNRVLHYTNSTRTGMSSSVQTSHSIFSLLSYRSAYLMPMFAFVLIVSGAGTSYFAVDSLPGDALYSIKTGLNENVEYALATSPEAKAELELNQISLRLDEAEVLNLTGNLTEVKRQVIQDNFSKKIESINKNTEKAKKSGNDDIVSKTNTKLDEEVSKHYGVFVAISNSASNSPTFSNLLKSQKNTKSVDSKSMNFERSVSPKVVDQNSDIMAMSVTEVTFKATVASDVEKDNASNTFSLKEVRNHKKSTDCWTVVSGNVYDLTPLIVKYPGGASLLKSMCGKDATKKFNLKSNKDEGMNDLLAEFKIGKLE